MLGKRHLICTTNHDFIKSINLDAILHVGHLECFKISIQSLLFVKGCKYSPFRFNQTLSSAFFFPESDNSWDEYTIHSFIFGLFIVKSRSLFNGGTFMDLRVLVQMHNETKFLLFFINLVREIKTTLKESLFRGSFS